MLCCASVYAASRSISSFTITLAVTPEFSANSLANNGATFSSSGALYSLSRYLVPSKSNGPRRLPEAPSKVSGLARPMVHFKSDTTFSEFLDRRVRVRGYLTPDPDSENTHRSSHISSYQDSDRIPLTRLNGAQYFRRDVTTIAKLPNEVLLSVFAFYLDTSPRSWHRLVHVCRRWRHVIFASPRGLRLRLYCTYGAPVSEALDLWPALPIVLQYGGSPTLHPPSPGDEDNIVAALKYFDRVRSISLTVTGSLLERLGTIEEPFSELEDLVLLSQDRHGQMLPGAFRWGPHLRSLHTTGIAFRSLPQLLSVSQNLIDVQIHEIPSFGYFPPEAFADALAVMPQLQSLSLHFTSLPSRRDHIGVPPKSGAPSVLPTLSRLKFRGNSRYLNGLLARIDAPSLRDIEIFFFHQLTFDVSQLGKFINRTEIQKSHRRTDILITERTINISFTQPGSPTRLGIHTSCEQFDWQLFSITQIFNHLYTLLSRIKDLRINATRQSLASVQDDTESDRWLELIRLFGGARTLRVAGDLTPEIVRALRPSNEVLETVLPALRNLYVQGCGPLHAPSQEDLVSLVVWRRLSGCPISVGYMQPSAPPAYQCLNCDASFTQHQILSGRMNDGPDARIRCHFCHRFTCSQGRPHLYQEHLRRRHPDVAPPKFSVSNRLRDSSPDIHGSQKETYPFDPIVSKRTHTTPGIPWLQTPRIAELLRDDSSLFSRSFASSLEASCPRYAWMLDPHNSSTNEHFGGRERIRRINIHSKASSLHSVGGDDLRFNQHQITYSLSRGQ